MMGLITQSNLHTNYSQCIRIRSVEPGGCFEVNSNKRFIKLSIFSAIAGLLLLAGAMFLPRPAFVTPAAAAGDQPEANSVASPSATKTIYLPFITQPGTQRIFGIETWYAGPSNDMDLITQAGAYYIRRNALLWSDIEPTQGTRNWTAGATPGMEVEFKNIDSLGKKTILIIRRTPSWAQQVQNSFCGPMKETQIAAFANFMYDVVKRYSAPPYNVEYFELWNEPEAALENAERGDYIFGCWGSNAALGWQSGDPYYGGRYYAKVLKQVYPKVKSANANAKLLVGGLLFDCDPVNTIIDPNTNRAKDCTSSKYLEGILVDGGVDYFDGVSYHAYDYYYGGLGVYKNYNWKSAWNTTGPTQIAKTNYLKDLLAKYNGSSKTLILSETALVCDSGCDSTFQQTKANYLTQSFAVAAAQGIKSVIWYHFFDVWRESGLVDHRTTPQTIHPAYYAFQFAQKEIGNASSGREISQEKIKIFEINSSVGRVWVAWSLDGTTQKLSLPSTPLAAYDKVGNKISATNPMTVTVNPIYIELPSE